ncbi:hypothetical protein ACJVDH_09875 [Pedobacter sp. AW1-32]|uniref:hypothetical protein n=1 Tax=Pedobacter sp. AW1-32 TaxID=3383026 RepID=UPI003FF11632
MRSINDFVREVTHARKRTGIVLLNDPELLSHFEDCGLNLINLAEMEVKKIIQTDDELLTLIMGSSSKQATLVVNLELFIAPRLNDLKYLEYLLTKLIVKEPRLPVFLGFYSEVVFTFFKKYYFSQSATQTHVYEAY